MSKTFNTNKLFLFSDSEKGYEKVISSIARKYNKEYTVDIKLKILGTPEPETARLAVKEMNLPITTEQFLAEYKEGVWEELKNPPLLPGWCYI